jgi:hypothetical protein
MTTDHFTIGERRFAAQPPRAASGATVWRAIISSSSVGNVDRETAAGRGDT